MGLAGVIQGPIQSFKSSGGVNDLGSYRTTLQWWCQPVNMPDSARATVAAFRELCARKGGKYEDAGFCGRTGDREDVLFMARVRRDKDLCEQVVVTVAEPSGSANDPQYRAYLGRSGFQTTDVLAAAQRAEQQRRAAVEEKAAADRRAAQARYEAELPLMRKKGTTICHIDAQSGNTFKGYVEDSTDEKIRISVSEAFRTSVPSPRPGGFQPQVIWDYPSRWRLC